MEEIQWKMWPPHLKNPLPEISCQCSRSHSQLFDGKTYPGRHHHHTISSKGWNKHLKTNGGKTRSKKNGNMEKKHVQCSLRKSHYVGRFPHVFMFNFLDMTRASSGSLQGTGSGETPQILAMAALVCVAISAVPSVAGCCWPAFRIKSKKMPRVYGFAVDDTARYRIELRHAWPSDSSMVGGSSFSSDMARTNVSWPGRSRKCASKRWECDG